MKNKISHFSYQYEHCLSIYLLIKVFTKGFLNGLASFNDIVLSKREQLKISDTFDKIFIF